MYFLSKMMRYLYYIHKNTIMLQNNYMFHLLMIKEFIIITNYLLLISERDTFGLSRNIYIATKDRRPLADLLDSGRSQPFTGQFWHSQPIAKELCSLNTVFTCNSASRSGFQNNTSLCLQELFFMIFGVLYTTKASTIIINVVSHCLL